MGEVARQPVRQTAVGLRAVPADAHETVSTKQRAGVAESLRRRNAGTIDAFPTLAEVFAGLANVLAAPKRATTARDARVTEPAVRVSKRDHMSASLTFSG
jgi:hypothetical protein